MKSKKILCLLIVVLTAFVLNSSFSYLRAEEDPDEDAVRTSAQYYPFYGAYGSYNLPYGSPYNWQYPFYPFNFGYGFDLFGIQNLYYPVNLQGTNFVFQFPFAQIAPYIGATAFWQNQFPNADWSRILATQFLGLINLPGLPYLF